MKRGVVLCCIAAALLLVPPLVVWGRTQAPGVFTTTPVDGPTTPVTGPAPNTPVTTQDSIDVFSDDFSSGSTFGTYQGLGGASVSFAPGALSVQVPPGATSAGFQITVPPGGAGVRCMTFDGFKIPDPPSGAGTMEWTWLGYDDVTGAQVVVFDTTVEVALMAPPPPPPPPAKPAPPANSFTIRHRKAGNTLVTTTVPNKKFSDVKKYKWDTRRGGTQVMLEIEFNDGTTYNSTWLDPSASTIAGFQVVGSVPSYSLSSVEGTDVHVDSYTGQPETVMTFDSRKWNSLGNYTLRQIDDSDLVAVGRVIGVHNLLAPRGADPRPRLRVVYELSHVLRGKVASRRIAVLHAVDAQNDAGRFAPDREFILFLQRGSAPDGSLADWYFDYGQPAGAVPFSTRNLAAVTSRISAFYNGGAADEDNSATPAVRVDHAGRR